MVGILFRKFIYFNSHYARGEGRGEQWSEKNVVLGFWEPWIQILASPLTLQPFMCNLPPFTLFLHQRKGFLPSFRISIAVSDFSRFPDTGQTGAQDMI